MGDFVVEFGTEGRRLRGILDSVEGGPRNPSYTVRFRNDTYQTRSSKANVKWLENPEPEVLEDRTIDRGITVTEKKYEPDEVWEAVQSAPDPIALDVEATGLDIESDRIIGLCFGWYADKERREIHSGYINVKDTWSSRYQPFKQAKPILEDTVNHRTVCGHKLWYDIPILRMNGADIDPDTLLDTKVACFILDERAHNGLDSCVERELDYGMKEFSDFPERVWKARNQDDLFMSQGGSKQDKEEIKEFESYGAEDGGYTLALMDVYNQKIDNIEELRRYFDSIEMPSLKTVIDLNTNGVRLNREYMMELDQNFEQELNRIAEEFGEVTGLKGNLPEHRELDNTLRSVIQSSEQLAHVLYGLLGTYTDDLEEGKAGHYSTAKAVILERKVMIQDALDLIEEHGVNQLEDWTYDEAPSRQAKQSKDLLKNLDNGDKKQQLLDQKHAIEAVIEYKKFYQLKSTFTTGLIEESENDGTARSSFTVTQPPTGRLASASPNLQNIPIRSEEGRKIRKAFIPRDGYTMIAADYSQAELRVLAHYSGDESLVKAYRNDEDVHENTRDDIREMGIDVDRDEAKMANYLFCYQGGPRIFRESLDFKVTRAEAQKIRRAWFETKPGVVEFYDKMEKKKEKQDYVKTICGRRRRYLDEISLNVVANFRIQGSVGDLMKLSMRDMDRRIEQDNFDANTLLQVHDELVYEVRDEQLEPFAGALEEEMETPGGIELRVPMEVDAEWGESWKECK